MTTERITYLHQQYLQNVLTLSEHEELKAALSNPDFAKFFDNFAEIKWNEPDRDIPAMNENSVASIYDYVVEQKQIRKSLKLWHRIAVAAAAVAAVVFGVYLFTPNRHLDTVSSRTAGRDLLDDISPGRNGATITLGNGKIIELSDAKSGVVIGDRVSYSDGSAVRYSSGTSSSGSLKGSQNSSGPVGVRSLSLSDLQGADSKGQMLTAKTAKGQTYQFTLSDGTRVWLNAESKISFPSQFSGKERKVLLTGEAYFAVVHNEKQPFRVESRGQIVEDIGTAFNINAYADEASVKTTLVEGSAKVNGTLLKPDQQAVLNAGAITIKQVNAESYMSWKEGIFSFRNETLPEVMRKIARWYNVQIVFEGEQDGSKTYSGSVSRADNVSSILSLLEQSEGIRFRVEHNRIIVKQK